MRKKHYPFGMLQPGRKYSAGSGYRYGFNGKELDTEEPVQYDYGFRIYDPRLGRFKSLDPLTKNYPWYTPYQFAGNKPIEAIDLDGLEPIKPPLLQFNPYVMWHVDKIVTPIERIRESDPETYKRIHKNLGVYYTILAAATGGGIIAQISKQFIIGMTVWLSKPESQQYASETIRFVAGVLTPPEANVPDDPNSFADDAGRLLRNLVGTIWKKAYGTIRGQLLEGVLSKTRYKLWDFVAGANTKIIDFIKGTKAASLKTFDAKEFNLGGEKGFKSFVDKLFDATKDGGVVWSGTKYKFNEAQLDIMFKDDATLNKFKDKIKELKEYAQQTTQGKVIVNVFVDPQRKAN